MFSAIPPNSKPFQHRISYLKLNPIQTPKPKRPTLSPNSALSPKPHRSRNSSPNATPQTVRVVNAAHLSEKQAAVASAASWPSARALHGVPAAIKFLACSHQAVLPIILVTCFLRCIRARYAGSPQFGGDVVVPLLGLEKGRVPHQVKETV